MEIKFFKKQKSFKKHASGLKPSFFWKLIVYLAFILIIGSFVFGYYLFTQINKESVLPEVSSSRGIIKKEQLKKVLDYFEARKIKSVEILNSPSPVVDPSL